MSLKSIKVREVDWFFMSYDEPNANSNWSDLVSKVPWAQRVHGVKGFDAVHRKCGELSNTEWLVTVDGDTRIDDRFLDIEQSIYTNGAKNFCWGSENFVNGLVYGNGGIKLWHKPFISNMAFHELGSGMDFCWHRDYQQINKKYSNVYINGSKYQAFRAGYREGVKLTTLKGRWIEPKSWIKLPEPNKRLLGIWASIGMDVEFGDMSILGTRTGMYDSTMSSSGETRIIDFDYIDSRLDSFSLKDETSIEDKLNELGNYINENTTFKVLSFSSEQSRFIKDNYILTFK